MKTKQVWSIGIDPGFGLSGVVLVRDKEVVDWALHSMPPSESPDWIRAASLASGIIQSISSWVDTYKIEAVMLGVEVPVYNLNPRTFCLQSRLLQEIETGLTIVVGSEVEEVYITEVNPGSAKKALTGNARANKKDMIAAGPWARSSMTYDERHTLSDAYAMALCADTKLCASTQLFTPWSLVREKE
jgi:Holliday junction resolvasome RuvABC endonuclease subunit